MAWRARVIQTQVKGVAAHMKQARAWTSVEVTERLAAQPPPPPCVPRVPLREMRRVDGVGRRGDCVGGPLRRWRGGRHSVDGVEVPRGRTRRDATLDGVGTPRVPGMNSERRVDGVKTSKTHRPPPKPKPQTIGGPSIDFQEFVRRQGRDSSRRARKAEARQKETPRECSFQPRLCENSKRMARNSKFDDRAAPASSRVDGVWVVRYEIRRVPRERL